MSSKRLIDLIKSYKGKLDVQVDIYFTNGLKTSLHTMSIGKDSIVAADKKEYPLSMISHAEIYSL